MIQLGHIIYVNGELANDHTPLGRLVHDFSCLHSKDIYNETFKECVKHFKETEEGIQTMCSVMEELRNEGTCNSITCSKLPASSGSFWFECKRKISTRQGILE